MNRWSGEARRVLLLILLSGGLPLLALRVDPRAYAGGRSRDAVARSVRNTSAIARLLGELRTSLSDMMFIKTERYLHSGVGYVPHHSAQLLSVEEMGAEVDEHQSEIGAEHAGMIEDPSHAGTQTLIPDVSRDYRGFIGTLHRSVKPWRDPSRAHLHSDGTQLLPWFRIMTLNDPNYVMGYAVGGWWVSLHDVDASLAFLAEGIRNNPDAFQIRLTRGMLLLRMMRRPEVPRLELLDDLLGDFREAARLGVAQRPDPIDGLAEDQPGWSLFQEQDLWTACQTLVLLEKQYGDAVEAHRLAQAFLGVFPDNTVLRNVLLETALER